MSDKWVDRLSEYVDGDLEVEEARQLEAHLTTCASCRKTLAELGGVIATAAALPDREPSRDLWSGIADRIRAAHTGERPVVALGDRRGLRRRFAFTAPQLLAAAATLLIVAVSTTILAVRTPAPLSSALDVAPAGLPVSNASYEAAVSELAHALDAHRDQLDSSTVLILEQSLATIDRAIEDAVEALRQEPNDQFLNAHLAHTQRQKLALLTRAVALATASS